MPAITGSARVGLGDRQVGGARDGGRLGRGVVGGVGVRRRPTTRSPSSTARRSGPGGRARSRAAWPMPPSARVPRFQVTVPAASTPPPSAETNEVPAGTASVTTTFVASDGPSFVDDERVGQVLAGDDGVGGVGDRDAEVGRLVDRRALRGGVVGAVGVGRVGADVRRVRQVGRCAPASTCTVTCRVVDGAVGERARGSRSRCRRPRRRRRRRTRRWSRPGTASVTTTFVASDGPSLATTSV